MRNSAFGFAKRAAAPPVLNKLANRIGPGALPPRQKKTATGIAR
jgi:hypothetical protein